jgi:hypothetical protein
VPVELIILSLVFKWGFVFEVIEWALIELIGFSVGLTIGTLFRKASITIIHHIGSFFLALFFVSVVILGFWDFVCTTYSSNKDLRWIFLAIPYLTSIYNFSQIFVQGETGSEDDVNTGTSRLTGKFTGLVAVFVLIWLILPSVGKALGPL